MDNKNNRSISVKIFHRHQLLQFQNMDDLIQRIEHGFLEYSQGNVNMPPVCHMHFNQPPGDLHIKCASMPEAKFYVVKIASCFPENSKLGQPSIKAMMLLFSQKTGEPVALFLDEGYLTHLRTAIAGAICAKYLAPKNPQAIGIIGAGMQARHQLRLLAHVTSCRKVWVWAPNRAELEKYQADETLRDFEIHLASSAKEVAEQCRLIVTTTSSSAPLLFAQDIAKGTHITAVGSDSLGKQELDSSILKLADRIIVDSRAQCFSYGETFCALQARMISKNNVDEIGEIISGNKQRRRSEDEITIADLTGLGVQDLEIALGFWEALKNT
jgi:ornithine cyclodeaminase